MNGFIELFSRFQNAARRGAEQTTNAKHTITWDASENLAGDHPWHFAQTSPTGGTLTAGFFFLGGVLKDIFTLPATITVTATTKYWLVVEIAAGTVNWASGTTYPNSDADTEIWPMLEITCAGGFITAVLERQLSDIHMTLTP